jgi:hypothetical protein
MDPIMIEKGLIRKRMSAIKHFNPEFKRTSGDRITATKAFVLGEAKVHKRSRQRPYS